MGGFYDVKAERLNLLDLVKSSMYMNQKARVFETGVYRVVRPRAGYLSSLLIAFSITGFSGGIRPSL